MRRLMILLVVLLGMLNLSAQDNSVYIQGGTLVFEVNLSVHVEHKLVERDHIFRKLYVEAFYQSSLFIDNEGDTNNIKYPGIGLVGLWGSKRNFFEAGIKGFRVFSNDREFGLNGFLPGGTLGYRVETDHYIMKTGIGFPDFIYFGFGYRF